MHKSGWRRPARNIEQEKMFVQTMYQYVAYRQRDDTTGKTQCTHSIMKYYEIGITIWLNKSLNHTYVRSSPPIIV